MPCDKHCTNSINMKLHVAVLLFATLKCCQVAFAIGGNLLVEYTNSAALDAAEKVKLYWSVDWNAKSVSFAVEAQTTGWVGFGISAGRGRMRGADIVIGGVTDEGKQYFKVSQLT